MFLIFKQFILGICKILHFENVFIIIHLKINCDLALKFNYMSTYSSLSAYQFLTQCMVVK